MSKQFEVIEKNLEKEVIKDYLIHWNASLVARKYNLNTFNVLRYIAWARKNKPAVFEHVEEKLGVDVFKSLKSIIKKLDKKVEDWNDDPLLAKGWFMAVDQLRQTLKDYAGIYEKLVTHKEQKELREAFLEVVEQESPEIAQRIIDRLNQYKEKRLAIME